MNNSLFTLIFLFCLSPIFGQSPNFNEYKYVVVPDKFDFLKGHDEYKLNSMTVFYLKKYGFNAYLESEAPKEKDCNALYADVEELNAFLALKVKLVLRNCASEEIYSTKAGMSKIKDYEKGYQDALRKSMRNLATLGVQQPKVQPIPVVSERKIEVAPLEPAEVKEEVKKRNLPENNFLSYTHNGKSFLLRKAGEGFYLYEENASAADGFTLYGKLIEKNGELYFDVKDKVPAPAAFDEKYNLYITPDATTVQVFRIVD